MPVKRKLNKKRTKMPRNVKINQKGSKRASQKKRGRSGRGRKSQRGGVENECEEALKRTDREEHITETECTCSDGIKKGTCKSHSYADKKTGDLVRQFYCLSNKRDNNGFKTTCNIYDFKP